MAGAACGRGPLGEAAPAAAGDRLPPIGPRGGPPHLYSAAPAPGGVDGIAGRLRSALRSAVRACPRSSVLALSGGLDSSIIAHIAGRGGEGPSSAVAVIARDFVATDLAYCQMAARSAGLPLRIVHAGTDDLLDAAAAAVGILGTFNDIEVRNSAASYIAARAALEGPAGGSEGGRGRVEAPCLVTGDGADELFAGYSFFLAMPRERLAGELARMRRIMRFASHDMGRSLGVDVASPFLSAEVVDIAASADAGLMVGRAPARDGAGRGRGGRGGEGAVCGKMLLRRAFEGVLPPSLLWRPKAPAQDGSGTAGLQGLLDAVVADDEFERRRAEVLDEDGVALRTKESLHYYGIYRRLRGRPPRAADPDVACPYCRCEVGADDRYCRMCGAYPV